MLTSMSCALGHHWALSDGDQVSSACPICGSPATERLADTATYGDRLANLEDTAAPSTTDVFTAGRGPFPQRFTILRPHAQGGLGRVSVARDERLGRDVALKEIRPDRIELPGALERFVNEAEITSQLEHPGVVPIYALEEGSAKQPYYAMRFIQGRTMAEVVEAYHRQPSPASFRGLLQRFVA